MKITACFCDLCAADGVATLATGKYRGDDWFDACDEHLEQVERFGMPTAPYAHPGDVDRRHLE